MITLNPQLFEALEQEFGRVKISNAGCAMTSIYRPGLDGKPRLQVINPGEYYIVVCPYCHDTTGHLYLNHRWGIRDPENGTRNLWLANCFLGNCMQSWDNRSDLAERLDFYDLRARRGLITVKEGVAAPPLCSVELPADFTLLAGLPTGHPARNYAQRRGFSPNSLSHDWGIGYSVDAYRCSAGRLVIPLRACLTDFADRFELIDRPEVWEIVGYQGRAINEDDKPKYLTSAGTKKSQMLYGLDRVPLLDTAPVVICEGVADVWSYGPGAVALFGMHVSDSQAKLMRQMFPGRNIVILLDPEARSEAKLVADRIQGVLARDLRSGVAPGRVVVACLPDERDPGACSTEEVRYAVSAALARQQKSRHR